MGTFSLERGMSCILHAKLFVLCMLFASAANAMTAIKLPGGATNDAVIKYIWVFIIAVLAWASSSLPVLAEWADGGGKRRLTIAQGILQAVFFGFVAFWASIGTGQSIMASYIAAASAAYVGDRHFLYRRERGKDQMDVLGGKEGRNES